MICRAEEKSIMLISSDCQVIIPFERYALVKDYLKKGIHNSLLGGLEEAGFLSWMDENSAFVLEQMEQSENLTPPENAYAAPALLNIELTTRCPLRCPQCYCDLHRGKDISFKRAVEVLKEAAAIGVSHINLSGGETMVYPHLYELIEECSSLGMYAAVALSGYGVNEASVKKLIESGVNNIYISLNGSTEEISRFTRDGHQLAIDALKLLYNMGYKNTYVNWVFHKSNADDFSNVVDICEKMKVKSLVVISFKPDASHQLESAPTKEQFLEMAKNIKKLQDKLPIIVESCYSPLRAVLGQRFFLNVNRGISRGCGAGRDGASLDVDGNFTPCRHLDFPENFNSLKDYWYQSNVLKKLRLVEADTEKPCAVCQYNPYCLSCMAISAKLDGRIVKANKYCPLGI